MAMKYSIGYQLPDEYDSIAEIVQDYREHISSVYFSPPGAVSARSVIPEDEAADMIRELRFIREQGVSLTMLFNANCYGDGAVSSGFRQGVVDTVGRMLDQLDISDVTTTSPFVARVIKQAFPGIRVCASVNMWIGTIQAMEYLGDDFNGYYIQREYNRNFSRIRQLHDWCQTHGKELRLLANSGCLYMCPFHTFHDNLVAHEGGASRLDNAYSDQPSPCWDMMYRLPDAQAAAVFLQESWIRPEDIVHYEPYFSEIKLATRMHSNPRRVVAAYARGRFRGNMMDLTEPSYSRRFSRHILDASRVPADWFERTADCSKDCDRCGYCAEAAKAMLVSKAELESMYLGSSW